MKKLIYVVACEAYVDAAFENEREAWDYKDSCGPHFYVTTVNLMLEKKEKNG